MAKIIKHRSILVLLLGGGLLLLVMGNVPVIFAQDSTSTPEVTAQPTPNPESTPELQNTPDIQNAAPPVAEASDESAGILNLTGEEVFDLVISVLIVLLAILYGGKLLAYLLRKLTRRSPTDFDEALLEELRPQLTWLMTAVGFQIATIRLNFISDTLENILETTYFVLYLFVGIAIVWRSVDFSMAWYVKKQSPHVDNKAAEELQPLVQRASHIILAAMGVILLLEHFGVSITALMATLGLTGFALSLALKDTITNIISGLVIMVDRPFNLGERIYVSDIDGWADVTEIGIRTTKVVSRDNRLVIVPNSSVVDNSVVNYSQPDSTYRLQTDIGVGYGMDIPTIHRVFTDTVRNVEGVLPDKSVDVLFTGFGPSAMTIRVRWWVASYTEKRKSSHRVNSAIQEAAEKHNINMPNPTMDNNLKISLEDANGASKTLQELN